MWYIYQFLESFINNRTIHRGSVDTGSRDSTGPVNFWGFIYRNHSHRLQYCVTSFCKAPPNQWIWGLSFAANRDRRYLSNAAAAQTASATAQNSKRVLRALHYKTLWLYTLCFGPSKGISIYRQNEIFLTSTKRYCFINLSDNTYFSTPVYFLTINLSLDMYVFDLIINKLGPCHCL